MKKIYKYQRFLLKLYESIGLNWQKTPVIRNTIGDKYLFYLRQNTYVERAPCPFVPRNQSDRMASWWRITGKGILFIQETFGDVFKKEDIPIITNKLLAL